MICEEALESISAKLDGALSESESHMLDKHLMICPACRKVYEELTLLENSMGVLDVEAPNTLVPSVMQTIRKERKQQRKPHATAWLIAAAAAIVLLLGATGVIDLPGFRGSRTSVSVGDAFSGRDVAGNTAAQLAQDHGCAVLLIRNCSGLDILDGVEHETLESGLLLYTVSADTMSGVMDAQLTFTMEVYTPQELPQETNDMVCILLEP